MLIPTLLWVQDSEVQFLPGVEIQALPAIPFEGGLKVGSRCKWGTSLAEWAVLSIAGAMAKVRQCSGWAEAIIWDAPISELVLLHRPMLLSEVQIFKNDGSQS